MVDMASLTDAESGTLFTADSKLDHALSRSPVGAFCTACASLLTWFQSSWTAVTSAWYWLFGALLGSRLVRFFTDASSVFRLSQRLETASVLLWLGSLRVPSTPTRIASPTPTA